MRVMYLKSSHPQEVEKDLAYIKRFFNVLNKEYQFVKQNPDIVFFRQQYYTEIQAPLKILIPIFLMQDYSDANYSMETYEVSPGADKTASVSEKV